MILLVSGEGPTDIGRCNNGQGQCVGNDFRAGPMAVIIDKLFFPLANYSLLDSDAMEFVSEHALSVQSRQLPMTLSAGKKRDYETGFFFKNARALAQLATARKTTLPPDTPVGAVLFRDADGTCSTEHGLWEKKVESMESGFKAEAFELGVPMVPKPKSEAWILCALKEDPYRSCVGLETSLSGNDNAANSAKKQLEERLQALGKTIHDLADMVTNGPISPDSIDMPSFNCFRDRLKSVTHAMLGHTHIATGA